MIERTAESCIGWDDGQFKVKGGRVNWQAVMYNCAKAGRLVKLARLEAGARPEPGGPRGPGIGIREFSCYVEPETILVFPDSAAAVFKSPAFDGSGADCPSCLGYGHFDEMDQPTLDRNGRKCGDCRGTGTK